MGLATKPFESIGVLLDAFGKELERNQAAKTDVLGLVHDTHSAAADFLEDAVMRDGLADHLGKDLPQCAQLILGTGVLQVNVRRVRRDCKKNPAQAA